MKIRIATRGSELALWQANSVKSQLASAGVKAELLILQTKGDRIQDLSFDKIEGKGFFTKEIEEALLFGEAEIAVHSLKDLPTIQPKGLVIAGLSSRARPNDLLIVRPDARDMGRRLGIREGCSIGTSSVRRKFQLTSLDSQVRMVDIRGNVPTRINKLRQGDVDAIVLAAAGVDRLNIDLSEFYVFTFHPEEFVPAPAQGVIAYQCREDALEVRKILKKLHHPDVGVCTNIERSVLEQLEGGCQLPLGVHCNRDSQGNFHCSAFLYRSDQDREVRLRRSQSSSVGLAKAIVFELTKD